MKNIILKIKNVSYTVSNAKSTTNRSIEILKEISFDVYKNIYLKAYNSKSVINITGDFRIGDIAHNIADIRKAEEILGYKQVVSLENGLQDFCDWVKKQEHDNSGYENSLNEMENAGMLIRK